MREQGVQVRATQSGKLLWKPKPEDMDVWMRMGIKQYMGDLVAVLYPSDDRLPDRDFWFHGPLAACFDCGQSTAHYDPLGQPRHSWCGWLHRSGR